MKLFEVMERRGVTVECWQEIPSQARDEGDQGRNDGITGTGQLCIPVPVMVCGSISYDNILGGKIVRKITLNFFF